MKKNNGIINLSSLNSLSITDKILKCNEKISKYGLIVSKEQAIKLLETRNDTLQRTDRVEFTDGIIDVLITTFASSKYITQNNLEEMINNLIEIFYYYKNETLDELDDYHIITLMKELFENKCYGEFELLNSELDKIAYDIRCGRIDYTDIRDDLEGFDFELPL
jgi:hypothetical protein